MNQLKLDVLRSALALLAVMLVSGLLAGNTIAGEATENGVNPEKFMVRMSAYSVSRAETTIAVLSNTGLGTRVSFTKDLGGEDSVTVPRFDAYYRLNQRHRIEFSRFTINRGGQRTIDIDINLGEETYTIGDTVFSEIKYGLTRIAYAYSFYHSPTVELSLSAGLNITDYEISYSRANGPPANPKGVSAPLPMFGVRGVYALNSKWSFRYMFESFFIEIEDTFKGSLLSSELDIEYRFGSGFVLGAGIARFSTDLTVKDSDWNGNITDSHRSVLAYAGYYF